MSEKVFHIVIVAVGILILYKIFTMSKNNSMIQEGTSKTF